MSLPLLTPLLCVGVVLPPLRQLPCSETASFINAAPTQLQAQALNSQARVKTTARSLALCHYFPLSLLFYFPSPICFLYLILPLRSHFIMTLVT